MTKAKISHYLISILIIHFLIKFPYNARSDWLKQRALSENRARVDDNLRQAGFQIFTLEF